MTDLSTAISEYSAELSHAEVLSALQSRTKTAFGMVESGKALAYFVELGKYSALRELALESTHSLNSVTVDLGDGVQRSVKEVAQATLDTVLSREGFDFSLPAVRAVAYVFVASGFWTEEQGAGLAAIGAKVAPEFENITLRDVIAVREPALLTEQYSNIETLNKINRNHLLIVQLSSDLPDSTNLQFQVRHDFGAGYTAWRGSSIAGLNNIKAAGTHSAVLPGEFVQSATTQIRIVCPFNVGVSLSTQVM